MQTCAQRNEASGEAELPPRIGEVPTGKLWRAKKDFVKGRQLNQVLEDKEEFSIQTKAEAFQETPFRETGRETGDSKALRGTTTRWATHGPGQTSES